MLFSPYSLCSELPTSSVRTAPDDVSSNFDKATLSLHARVLPLQATQDSLISSLYHSIYHQELGQHGPATACYLAALTSAVSAADGGALTSFLVIPVS